MSTELVQLVGSEKQIEWAENIRWRVMFALSGEREELAARIVSARWWIDNRDKVHTLEMLQAAVAENEANAEEEAEAAKRRASYARYKENLRRHKIKLHDVDGKLSL